MSADKTYQINLQPVGKRIHVKGDVSLLGAAQLSGVALASVCGGIGSCDSCKVRLISGTLTPLSLEEQGLFSPSQLKAGYRLACQAYPLSDITLDIPPDSLTTPQRLQIEGQEVDITPAPAVTPFYLKLNPPTLTDLRADTVRVKEAISGSLDPQDITFATPVLNTLSDTLRSQNWEATMAMRNRQIIAVLPPHTSLLGLAFDIGTTKLAAYLCDLHSGQLLTKAGAMNPQISFGEDVISRIAYTDAHPDGRRTLQRSLIETMNQLISELCVEASKMGTQIKFDQIVDVVAVGNTAMHHLFAGLPVHQLGTSPYVPTVSEALEMQARDLGLDIAPGAGVYLPPNIAGFVGADHVSMVLATGLATTTKTAIALDIGTNTEISLAYRDKLYSCSCASGPAFEGAHIHAGMRAAPGAIERLQIIGDTVRIQTIGGQSPVGICGSGILDAVAEMLRAGIISSRGGIQPIHPKVRKNGSQYEFVLTAPPETDENREVVITRQDVNEIQLAKAAIRAGVDILLKEAGIPPEELEQFIVAGAFGTYINIQSAIHIGMFPSLPLDRFQQVGNAAGTGARQMLVSLPHRQAAEEIARRMQYIELSSHPDFNSLYSKALFF